jgi:phage tail tape-measure protein
MLSAHAPSAALGGISGLAAGAVSGMIAGPPGLLAGALLGGAIGAAAGAAVGASQQQLRDEDAALDLEIATAGVEDPTTSALETEFDRLSQPPTP